MAEQQMREALGWKEKADRLRKGGYILDSR